MPSHPGKIAADRIRILESIRKASTGLSLDELLLVSQYIARLKQQRER